MKKMLLVYLLLSLLLPVLAKNNGVTIIDVNNTEGKESVLQSGENQNLAIVIDNLPFNNSGTINGFVKDYSFDPFSGTSGDVVYKIQPDANIYNAEISLCNSSFDTKLAIFSNSILPQNMLAFNDDYCNEQSEISGISLYSHTVYYIVITGHNNESGTYVFNLSGNQNRGIDLPYYENFEQSSFPADNWLEGYGYNNPQSNYSAWVSGNFANNSNNSTAAKINMFANDADWLISPEFYFEEGHSYKLSFDIALTAYGSSNLTHLSEEDTLFVLISDEGSENWNIANKLKIFDYTSNLTNQAQSNTINIDNYNGYRKIAFYAKGSGNNPDVELHIDNFSVYEDNNEVVIFSTSELDFKRVLPGSAKDMFIIINNLGSSNVVINSLPNIDGDSAFSTMQNTIHFPYTILPSQNLTLKVTFTPFELERVYSANLNIGYNTSFKTISLTGSCGLCDAVAIEQDEVITNITFANINNDSGYGVNGYQNFTNLTANLKQGLSYDISGTIAPFYSDDKVGIWCDWNQNGDFLDDNSEIIIDEIDDGNFTATINVPAEAILGTALIRIRACYNEVPQPCGVFQFGETEDYSLLIEEKPTVPYFASTLKTKNLGAVELNTVYEYEFKIWNASEVPSLFVNQPVLTGHYTNEIEIIDENVYPAEIIADTLSFKVIVYAETEGVKVGTIEISDYTREMRSYTISCIAVKNKIANAFCGNALELNPVNAINYGSDIENNTIQYEKINAMHKAKKLYFWGSNAICTPDAFLPTNNEEHEVFEISFYENNGNRPALTPYYTVTIDDFNKINTDLKMRNVLNVYRYEMNLPSLKIKDGWISIQEVSTDNDNRFLWAIGKNGDNSCGLWYNNNYSSFTFDLAFFIEGDVSSPNNLTVQSNQNTIAVNWQQSAGFNATFNVYKANSINANWQLVAEDVTGNNYIDENANNIGFYKVTTTSLTPIAPLQSNIIGKKTYKNTILEKRFR